MGDIGVNTWVEKIIRPQVTEGGDNARRVVKSKEQRNKRPWGGWDPKALGML